ncbi:MAG: diacylglycerol kinase family lipid kinase, partial [Alphaproteobacteria bacterium]
RRDVRIVAATRVRFTGPPGDPVQADGDLAAHLPVDMEIEPAALSLIVPPE